MSLASLKQLLWGGVEWIGEIDSYYFDCVVGAVAVLQWF